MSAALQAGSSKPQLRFNVTSRDRYDQELAQVGWLRSAYLVAFAFFGYAYIFQSRLENVRRQLIEPKSPILDTFSVYLPDASENARTFLNVAEPADLQGFAIQMGRHLVFLPWLNDALYVNLSERRRLDVSFRDNLSGQPLRWPTEPLHLVDLDRLSGISRVPASGDTSRDLTELT